VGKSTWSPWFVGTTLLRNSAKKDRKGPREDTQKKTCGFILRGGGHKTPQTRQYDLCKVMAVRVGKKEKARKGGRTWGRGAEISPSWGFSLLKKKTFKKPRPPESRG